MARTANIQSDFSGAGASLFHGVSAFFKALAKAVSLQAGMQSRLDQIARLNAKSDVELAELGIERDRIVHHVFRDIYRV